MDYKQRIKSINNSRIELTQEDRFLYWTNFIVIIGILVLLRFPINSSVGGFEQNITSMFFMALGLLFVRYKIKSRDLRKFKTSLSPKQFKLANDTAANKNEWKVVHSSRNYFEAVKHVNWQWEGIRITSILDGKVIFINSMVNPSLRSNPFTFGLNKRNFNELLKQYKRILSDNVVTK